MRLFVYPPVAVSVTTPPVGFELNGVATTVSQDTVTPANSNPLPVIQLDSSGNPATPLTDTQLRASPVPVDVNHFSPLEKVKLSVAGITDAAYTELLADTGLLPVKKIQIFMSSGEPLFLAYGASTLEQDQIIITPGGNGYMDCYIPAGTRLSLKKVDAGSVAGGEIIVNFLG